MTSKDKQLQTKIDEEIKKYHNLKNAFSTIYESEKDVQKKRQEVYEKISKIEEVDNSELSNIYKTFNRGTIDEKLLFCNFNLTVADGEFVALKNINIKIYYLN